jgi:SET family sugar efflux transporter-like MFS transporter
MTTTEQVAVAPTGLMRRFRDVGLNSLIASTGFIGVGGAMVVTSVSLFLANAVIATPLMIGLFFAGRALAEIATDLVVGVMSDRIGNRRALLAICSGLSACGAGSYALFRNYYVLLLCGAIFFGIGGATFSQLFAYTREFAESRGIGVAFFNSALRAVTSVAWIVGPPLGFFLIAGPGFSTLYVIAAVLYALAGVICVIGLPNVTRVGGDSGDGDGLKRPFSALNRQGALLLGVIVLMLTVNIMYQIDISLFTTKDLGFTVDFAGLLIGLAAALEVPIMLGVGATAERIGKGRLVLIATLCATLFFALLPLATTHWEILVLQVPNAIWTSIILSIPVVMLQDAMPDRPGVASALYSSAFKAGAFLGGAIAGSVAALVGFTDLFWVCAGITVVAAVLFVIGRRS